MEGNGGEIGLLIPLRGGEGEVILTCGLGFRHTGRADVWRSES